MRRYYRAVVGKHVLKGPATSLGFVGYMVSVTIT